MATSPGCPPLRSCPQCGSPQGQHRIDEAATEPENPLLLVPGIGGSMLHVREKGSSGEGERVWVTVRNAESQYERLWGAFNADTSSMECLAPGTEVVVPKGSDESGLYPISVLDPDAAFAVRGVHYMDFLIEFLKGQGYTPARDLYGFAYDYRQSTRHHTQALLARLHEVSRRSGGRKVDLLSHSLGGLLVRGLVAEAPREFGALVNTWVAVGCPFGGAPGWVVDALVTGVQFAGSLGQFFFVSQATSRQACLQSPSIYELLPPLDFPFKKAPPRLRIWLATPMPSMPAARRDKEHPSSCNADAQQPPAAAPNPALGKLPRSHPCRQLRQQGCTALEFATGRLGSSCPAPAAAAPDSPGSRGSIEGGDPSTITPSAGSGGSAGSMSDSSGTQNRSKEYIFALSDLPGLLEQLLADNTVTLDGQVYLLPFSQALWEYAQATQQLWGEARQLPEGCRFYNLYGTGLSTPYDVQYGSWWRPVKDLEQLPLSGATFSYVDGDMTVPSESALADGLRAEERVGVKVAHRDLISNASVWEQIMLWLRAKKQGSDDESWVLVPPMTAGYSLSDKRSGHLATN